MIDRGKRNVLGVLVDAVDYDAAVARILDAARARQPLAVSALAVHGVMTGALDRMHRARLNRLNLVTPDGQPVRWALNLLYRVGLRDRVYGPELTARVCAAVEREGLPIYLYGSRQEVLSKLEENLKTRFPRLHIAGSRPSAFRQISPEEQKAMAADIRASGARVTLVGLGCPRQEVWVFENAALLSMPALAVGAAFDFHAGHVRQAPAMLQRAGFEWLFRLAVEPRRLWRRYVFLNPLYLGMLAAQAVRLWHPQTTDPTMTPDFLRYG